MISTLSVWGCSSQIDQLSTAQSLRNYPKLGVQKIHCSGGGVTDSASVVLDSELSLLPPSEFSLPLDNMLVTSKMGCRLGYFHNGFDFAGIVGAPIGAIADGTVTFAGKRRLTGNTIVIFHSATGLESTYGHASENLVKKGDAVTAGQRIQSLGNTGQSTGPHLHLSISYQGAFVNPCALLGCR